MTNPKTRLSPPPQAQDGKLKRSPRGEAQS